jgi:hypothetical protein
MGLLDERTARLLINWLKENNLWADSSSEGSARVGNPKKDYYEELIEPDYSEDVYDSGLGAFSLRASNPEKSRGMTKAQRARIPLNDFVFPETRSWPIHDERHAILAIQYMERGFGRASDYPKIERAVASRYGHNPKVAKSLSYYRKNFK